MASLLLTSNMVIFISVGKKALSDGTSASTSKLIHFLVDRLQGMCGMGRKNLGIIGIYWLDALYPSLECMCPHVFRQRCFLSF